jgi:hypothetical protein
MMDESARRAGVLARLGRAGSPLSLSGSFRPEGRASIINLDVISPLTQPCAYSLFVTAEPALPGMRSAVSGNVKPVPRQRARFAVGADQRHGTACLVEQVSDLAEIATTRCATRKVTSAIAEEANDVSGAVAPRPMIAPIATATAESNALSWASVRRSIQALGHPLRSSPARRLCRGDALHPVATAVPDRAISHPR